MTSTLSKKHNFDGVFDSQKVFRLILEAMSNPSRVVNIIEYAHKLFGENSVFLAIAMTLLDNEVSFNTFENHALSDEIASFTFAKKDTTENSDFIFISDLSHMECAIKKAKCGTLADPHKNATVIIQNNGKSAFRLMLSGPGINGQTEVMITQTVKDAITIRDAQNYEYPQGIDMIFASSNGELLSIPRLIAKSDSH
jgi:alpha-D-ribose 1-methylphosphonate 5-triphosphate synthase subunit PhnH